MGEKSKNRRDKNGRSYIAGYEAPYGVQEWKQRIFSKTDFICMVYSKTRNSTLEAWGKAISMIDSYKRKERKENES